MRRVKSVFKKGVTLTLACTMIAGQAVPVVRAAGDTKADSNPTPVMYFDMESLTDGKLTDKTDGTEYVLSGNEGELVASVGTNGKALKFDGTNFVDLGTKFQPANAYTITGWVKQDPGATDGQAIVARAWSGDVKDQLATMVKGGAVYHAAAVGSSNSNFTEFFSPSVMDEGEWEHIAITRDHENMAVYVNGEKVVDKTDFPSDDFVEATKKMYMGRDCNGKGEPYAGHAFKGVLDEIRLYDTALTEEQVQELAYVEAPYEITGFANGKLEVKLADSITQNPAQEDFKLKFFVDGEETTVNVTGYEYKAVEKTAVFTFDALKNMQNVDRTVKVRLEYAGIAEEAEFVLPAGENKSPEVSDVTISNISRKLGAEPHVKGMLEAEYKFEDADNDAEGDTKYQWYISDKADGEYTALEGINTKTIILLHQYEGKYLKCEVTPADVNGNKGTTVMSNSTTDAVKATEGNPLTDWFYEAKFGISHHFLSNYFNLPHVYTSPEEMWDREKMTWDEFVGQFDAEAYAKQVNEIGVKFVLITLGQNSGSYCAPNAVYDKYMREAGFIKEGEANPKTTSMENDLPMKMANALEKYGIKVMLYLPSNPPHSASWDETGEPNGYGYFSDYLVTKKVFGYTPGYDGNPSQKSRKVLSEMVTWWSEHYGDKIAGWWFDGFYHDGQGSQFDMSLEYNIATLANAAKAGNPYNIVAFNRGIDNFQKMTNYTDYTAGEATSLTNFPNDGRWTNNFFNETDESERKADCQNFLFGPLGSRESWSNGWGCSGINHQDVNEVINAVDRSIKNDHVIGLDTRVNVHGQIDPAQYAQLKEVRNVVPANKTELQNLLNEANSLDLSLYTEESVKVYKEALAYANEVFADDTLMASDKDKVDDAVSKLRAAIDGLTLKEEPSKPDNGNGGNNNGGNYNNGNNNGGGNNADTGKKPTSPKKPSTGDAASVSMILMMAMVSAGAAGVVIKRKKKED